MSFFILTGAILLGTIVIVHFAANALGFRLFYTSLFLSAVLALTVNLIVISMKEVTSPLSIAKIFLIVLVSSAFVTIINDILTRYELKKLQKRRAKRKEKVAEKSTEDSAELEEIDEIEEIEEFEDEENFEENNGEEEIAPKKESFFKRLFKKVSSFKFKKKSDTAKEEIESLDAAKEPLAETIKEEVEVHIENTALENSRIETDTAEVDEDIQTESASEETENKPKNDGFFKKLFKKSEPPREKIDVSKFADLDAILDFAYDAKIAGKYLDAVDAYEGAIEKYENDPYLPFLFIDLGNVHKAQGEYNAAIDVYEKAVNMPNIQKDLNILRSFEENIDYLKALKIVLRKHKAEHKPFGEIDEAILKEVESNLSK